MHLLYDLWSLFDSLVQLLAALALASIAASVYRARPTPTHRTGATRPIVAEIKF